MPARNARSTSSGVATPSSTSRTASFINKTCSRGPMKPGESLHFTGTLPSRSSSASVRSTVAAGVGQRALGVGHRALLLDVDEPHAAATEREGQRDLPPDAAGAENGDGLTHAGSLSEGASTAPSEASPRIDGAGKARARTRL